MERRYALGLPSGSVRAMLTLMIVVIMVLLLVLPNHPVIPAHMVYLLLIGVTQFFASVGNRERTGEPGPLGLPTGTLRLVVIAMLAAVIIWRASNDLDGLMGQFKRSVEFMARPEAMAAGVFSPLFLPFLLMGGFFVGVLMHLVVGDHPPMFVQDIQAWFALICLVLTFLYALIVLIINPSLEIPIDPRAFNSITATVIAFYYGARS